MCARAIAALVAAAALLSAFAAEPPAGAFGLGVLRRDGFIIPFATFDGRKWRHDWPEPKRDVEVPVTLDSVPARWFGPLGRRPTWFAWVRQDPPREIHVRQPDWFDAHCLHQIGLRTDYRSSLPPPRPDAQPYPKDGLAVTPSIQIQRIDIVGPGDLPEAVAAAFDTAEDKALEQRPPLDPPIGAGSTPRVEAVYAIDTGPASRVYYFEVVREYKRPALGCQLLVAGAGWFVREGASPLRSLGFEAALAGCDRYGLRYMLPLGAIRIGARLFWTAQWSGWDYEDYTIVEIKAKAAQEVLRTWGGGC